jgi:hypothetical protein
MAAIGAGVLGLLCLGSSAYAAMNTVWDKKTPAQTVIVPDTDTDTETNAEAGSTPATISTGATKGQYVRLWQGELYQNQKAYALSILELEVYDSSGTNIAQGKSATARSQYPGDHQPVLAFDGSLDTMYRSNYDDKEDWLEVDLGSVMDIHKIVIRHPGSEDVYEGVAMKDGLRGYIEIFDGDQTSAKTEQIEETSTDHVYTYNFKERGGGKWRGGQGILKTRADLIAEKQAADEAADEEEQKRLASAAVVDKAAKAAKDEAAQKKAADKLTKDAADKAAADAEVIKKLNAKLDKIETDRVAKEEADAAAAAEAERVRIANLTVGQKGDLRWPAPGAYKTFAECWADAEGDWGRNGKFNCCESSGVPYPNSGDTGYVFCQDNT